MKKIAILTLVVIFALTGFLFYRMTSVKFDYDFEKFFPEDDPETAFFFEYRKVFESDNDYILVGLVNENGIFDQQFLQRADSLTQDLVKVKNIRQVLSITNYKEYIKSPLGPMVFESPAIHIDDPEQYANDSIKIVQSENLVGSLVATDCKSISLLLLTKEYISKLASDSLSKDLDAVLDKYKFDEKHLAGRSTGQSYYVNMMQQELLFFTITSFFLVVVFLFLSFRKIWGIVVPIMVVVFTAIWIVGYMELVGKGINLVLTILPTIMFVVGMSDVVHVITKYLEEVKTNRNKYNALLKTYKEVALATFLTSLTTAAGFLTLLTSEIEPVRDFGLYTAIGVIFAFILAYTLLPAILILSPIPVDIVRKEKKSFWTTALRSMLFFVIRKKRLIVSISLVLAGISIVGMTNLRINNFLLEDLDDDNELKKEFTFFDQHYSGARPFEMAVKVQQPVTDLRLTIDVLIELEKLEKYLRKNYEVGFMISPTTIVKSLNKNTHSGSRSFYKIPETQAELNELMTLLEKYKAEDLLNNFVSTDGKLIRVSGKLADQGSFIFRQKNKELAKFYADSIDKSKIDYQLTGTAVLIDKNNGQLSSGLVLGLIISFAIIAIIVGLMFFSWRMVIIALLPNILPIMMIGGIMGFLGIDLKVSTSMIFTIAFGIAVDDTIHFISKLKIELNKGKSILYAIKNTYFSTGKAIIYTSIILSGGFLTLVFSEFLGTYYIGLLVGLTLIFAVLCDLFLLPVLLIYFYKRKN